MPIPFIVSAAVLGGIALFGGANTVGAVVN